MTVGYQYVRSTPYQTNSWVFMSGPVYIGTASSLSPLLTESCRAGCNCNMVITAPRLTDNPHLLMYIKWKVSRTHHDVKAPMIF